MGLISVEQQHYWRVSMSARDELLNQVDAREEPEPAVTTEISVTPSPFAGGCGHREHRWLVVASQVNAWFIV